MKKFLAVFDGYKFSKSTMSYAIELAQLNDAHLVGVFLDEFIYHTYSYSKVYKESDTPEKLISKLDEADRKKRDASVSLFQKNCDKAGLAYSIHRDESIALQELKHESLFADLIIINKAETFTRFKEKIPTRFIKNLLGGVQCPVFVAPPVYKSIDKSVLLYDGRPSSLYALKMFSYLLGDLKKLPVEVFTVNDAYLSNMRLPDSKLMKEFVNRHYKHAKLKIVKGDPEEEILGYLRNHKENELVVLGAYRRGELSRLFKESMADVLMRELDTPLFIAHS